MAAPTSIDYLVKHKEGIYDFTVRLTYDPALSGSAARRWEIRKLGVTAPLAIATMSGGTWEWSPPDPPRSPGNFISLYDGRTTMLDMYFFEVPKDYLHGDFCSITSGNGSYLRGVNEIHDLNWSVYGPGCV